MRIGIAAIGRLSEDTGGKNYIVHFLKELPRQNSPHEFVLFVSDSEAESLGISAQPNLKIVSIPNSRRTPIHKVIAEQLRLPSYIKREKLDVVYYPGNFVSLLSNVPAVVNIRSSAHFYGPEYGIRWSRRWLRRMLMIPSARRARRIITPSEAIKSDVLRFTSVSPDKVTVIPHGVDTSLFDGDAIRSNGEGMKLLQQHALTPGNYLLYVSALWPYKRQDQLIRAHAELVKTGHPNLKLVIAGMGTGLDASYIGKIRELPKQSGTEHLVVFTGGLVQAELRDLYAYASAFVFPSIYESFGNPIFEAWSSGIPVAVSNAHSFPEVVGDAALIFDPNDLAGIVVSIERLLEDSALRDQLIQRGKERVKKFTWNECVARTLFLLAGVTSDAAMPSIDAS